MPPGIDPKGTRRDLLDGARAAVPVIVAVLPFGLLFGALAVSNGLGIFEAVLMSATVYGGASQMVGIELFGQQVAPWLIVFSIFAVNFRHVLYSAAFGGRIAGMGRVQKAIAFFFLTDPQFAEAEKRYQHHRRIGLAWYLGLGLPIYAAWLTETWIGAVFGRLIPDPQALGLDMLLPIYFLGLVLEFRMRAGWLPIVLVSAGGAVLAYQTIGSPWHVSLGAICGIAVAALLGGRPAPADGLSDGLSDGGNQP